MLGLRDLSFRYKIPLRGSLLVIVTACVVTLSMIGREYDDLRQDVITHSASLGRVLARTLVTPITHDDLWRAYEIINSPFLAKGSERSPQEAREILVLTRQQQVYVSTRPRDNPVLTDAASHNPDLHYLQRALDAVPKFDGGVLEPPESDSLYILTPIVSDGVTLGTLVMAYARDAALPRFLAIAERAALVTAIAVCVLIIASWFWARRFAEPLVELAKSMEQVGERLPAEHEITVAESRDEIGRLGTAFRTMVRGLRDKEALKQQVIFSEKLAAVGRLAAAIAHEVNNPLGGMLNCINTLRHHGQIDAFTARNLDLMERGLVQIRDTVSAMLVEAKVQAHDLSNADFDDIRTLVEPGLRKLGARLEWDVSLPESVPLASTLVRQIVLNLLLNATNAVADSGRVGLRARADGSILSIEVSNDGRYIPQEEVEYVFEPFWTREEGGHGLGLWVSYQVAMQLGGSIEVSSAPGDTRFTVSIPTKEASDAGAALSVPD